MRKGFTIVEAAVVVAIICTMALLLIPAISAARAKAREQHRLEQNTAQIETLTPGKFQPPYVKDAILRENFEYQQEKIRLLEERLERLEGQVNDVK